MSNSLKYLPISAFSQQWVDKKGLIFPGFKTSRISFDYPILQIYSAGPPDI